MNRTERVEKIKLSMFLFDKGKFPAKVAGLTRGHRSAIAKTEKKLLYFAKYLEDICASVVIVEEGYTDKNLQSDHWAFPKYADPMRRHPCFRLHFFGEIKGYSKVKKIINSLVEIKPSDHLKEEKLEKLEAHNLSTLLDFLAGSLDDMKDSYLGFMVIRPEGSKMVGTTCLGTYPVGNAVHAVGRTKQEQKENREIPTVMEYSVNLVGHKMSVDSIGFQEQDGVTSACATCSLWSLFQGTSRKYQHHSLSPGKITALALGIEQHDAPLPKTLGLTIPHMEKAIRSIPGIHPLNITYFSSDERTSTDQSRLNLNSVLNFALPILDYGIPVILQIEKIGSPTPYIHAICLVGYNYSDSQNNAVGLEKDEDAITRATKITSLIAHDDNVGPFVQYDIDDNGHIAPLRDYLPENDSEKYEGEKWHVSAAITALHNSVRIYPHIIAHKIISSYDQALRAPSKSTGNRGKPSPPEWTSKIWDSRDYKQVLVDYVHGNERDNEQARKKLGLSEKSNMDPSYLHRVQSCNFPMHIMILHARNEIEHDVILNLAEPWDTEIFLHVIPFGSNAENHLNKLADLVENDSKSQDNCLIGPILSYILKFFKK